MSTRKNGIVKLIKPTSSLSIGWKIIWQGYICKILDFTPDGNVNVKASEYVTTMIHRDNIRVIGVEPYLGNPIEVKLSQWKAILKHNEIGQEVEFELTKGSRQFAKIIPSEKL